MSTRQADILAAHAGELDVDLHVRGEDRVISISVLPDPDLELAVREEWIVPSWWTEPVPDEQIAWETLMADAHETTVTDAGARFAEMLDAMTRGARDDVPY